MPLSYDNGTNTLTWNQGEEVTPIFRKLNVGTVTSPTIDLMGTSTTAITAYNSSNVATVTQDGTTVIFTCPKFLNTMPAGPYKLHLKGTVNSLAQDIHTVNIVVLKRNR